MNITNSTLEVASRDEIKEGKAQILCQLDNTGTKTYEIEIEKIYKNNNIDNKSMFIKVTDKDLIEKTGGIIQGMSGAPIIQNGKF
ncbi:stage IV sporulation protein B, partial [human gut metagenome]